ncbi:MAG: hypothetical protein Q7K35_05835 [bacterium]|nr:hypothetical protein [bacterium]
MRKVIIFLIFVAIISVSGFYYFWPEAPLIKAAQSAGGYPYQIGLTNVIVIPCVTTGVPPICTGGTLCNLLDVGRCALYSDVSGSPAGGMGSNALFLITAIAQAGLTSGGQLIAGGMTMTQMDSGVLASAGGCYGCMAKAGFKDKIINWFDKYIIAGIRGK